MLHARLVDEFVGLAACSTISPAGQNVASGLPAPLEAPSKSLGCNRSVGQPSANLLSGAFFQLPDRCELLATYSCILQFVQLLLQAIRRWSSRFGFHCWLVVDG